MKGCSIKSGKKICNNCKNEITGELGNFCSVCGNPLSLEAIEYSNQHEKNIKLKVAEEIISYVKDSETAKKIVSLIRRF